MNKSEDKLEKCSVLEMDDQPHDSSSGKGASINGRNEQLCPRCTDVDGEDLIGGDGCEGRDGVL